MRLMQWMSAVCMALVVAAVSAPVLAQTKGASGAVEEQIRTRMQELLGNRPDSVTRTPYGVFEVVVGTDVYYTDQATSYVMIGRLIDAKTRQDVTQARRDELMKVDYAKLPLDQAVRLRVGKGTRQFVTFEDPNCPYCRKLHNDIQGMKDVTVYVFLYPILSPESFEKAKNIWCSKDRAAAWNAAMIEGKAPAVAAADCKHPLQQNLQLGQRLGVNGTPTLIFQDGSRMPGASSADEIEKRLVPVKK
ncbi:MAG: DsbC family protein [Burkholderiaceae bacterium]|nr:DsbC family protein [Burkholderiaceae bacterium]